MAQVFDAFGNPVPAVEVTFQVEEGGGILAGGDVSTTLTDAEGKAAARFRLGPEAGIGNHRVSASFPGLDDAPASFAISGLESGPEEDTRVAGLVLDNQDEPVPGVIIQIAGTGLETTTDEEGKFVLEGAPVGAIDLLVEGSTTSRPGSWPHLEFRFVTVSGRENDLGMPIRLLPLDDASARWVGGSEDVGIPITGVSGAELTVFADSVTFPDGAKTGWVSVTQVHSDKVPMVAPQGSNFMLAWTVQPPGVRFDPPARIAIPNVGEPPGTVVDMFSFDHDRGEFVSVGTASVSEDGLQLNSNPGAGVVKAGWHGCVPPPEPPGDSCNPSVCKKCSSGSTAPRFSIGPLIAVASAPGADLRVPEDRPDKLANTFGVFLGQPVHFQAAAGADCALDYHWLFGDGRSDGDQSAIHTYETPGLVEARATAKCVACPSPARGEDVRVMVIKEVKVQEVSLSGEKFHTVLEDGYAGPYEAPHWQDNSMPRDGDAEDVGDRRFPVSFTRGTSVIVDSAKLHLEPAIPEGVSLAVQVRATGSDGLSLPPTPATIVRDSEDEELNRSQIEVGPIAVEGELPNTVARLTLTFDWQVSFDGGETWADAGTSDHRTYLTLKDPVEGTPLHETVLDIGCRNAHGATDETTTVVQAWSEFTDRSVKRKQIDGHNKEDGLEMRYWVDPQDPHLELARACQTVQHMLDPAPSEIDPEGAPGITLEGVGSCIAWSRLFHRLLRSHGIAGSEFIDVVPDQSVNPEARWFLVKEFRFGEHLRNGTNGIYESTKEGDDVELCELGGETDPNRVCVTPGPNGILDTPEKGDDRIEDGRFSNSGIPYSHALFDSLSRFESHGRPEGDVADLAGIPAQGEPNPQSIFNRHFIILYDGKYYDPSYGVGPFENEIDHENSALAGVAARADSNEGTWLVVNKPTSEQELVYSPRPDVSD